MSLWFATSSTIFHRTWSIVLCNTWISVVSHYKMGWFRSRSFVWNPPGVPMWARWFSPGISIIINHQPSILITTTISIINHHRKKCLKNVNSSWQSHDRNVPMFFSTCFPGWWYTYPSEKYEFVSWDDDIPNIWKKYDVPNHQPVIQYLSLLKHIKPH